MIPRQGKIIIVDQIDYTTPNLHNTTANNVPFLGKNSFESVGVGLLKDSLLMGVFPLLAPPTPHVSMLNMIFTQVQQSLELSDPLVVPGLDEHSYFHVPSSLKNETNSYKHSSLSLSRLLKNKTDPHPFESSLTLDRILEPYFPPPSENIHISSQMPK
jgi:hypothetical protein